MSDPPQDGSPESGHQTEPGADEVPVLEEVVEPGEAAPVTADPERVEALVAAIAGELRRELQTETRAALQGAVEDALTYVLAHTDRQLEGRIRAKLHEHLPRLLAGTAPERDDER